MIKTDMKCLLVKPRFYITIFISLFILLRPMIEVWENNLEGTFLQFLSIPFGTSDFAPFAALFCVYPFADSFCKEYTSKYAYFIVRRIGIKKYSHKKSISVFLSGAIVMTAIVGITIYICLLTANQPDTEITAQFMQRTIWAELGVLVNRQELLIGMKLILAFLFGGLWALIGLVISILIPNQYITLIAPFVLYQFLWFTLEGKAVNPVYMLRGDSNYIPSFAFAILWQLMLITVCYLVACIGIRKRVSI